VNDRSRPVRKKKTRVPESPPNTTANTKSGTKHYRVRVAIKADSTSSPAKSVRLPA
jgi:hypothetical protein